MEKRDNAERRPSADALLREAQQVEQGRLKIFLGAAPGVGKTYEMLTTARAKKAEGTDVVAGIVETHGRKETEALLQGLEIIPPRAISYRDHALSEMDLDAILARRPRLVLVDELAHANAPESRHPKRYMDVEERRDRRLYDAQHPACRKPQRHRRRNHQYQSPRDGARFDRRQRR